MLPSDEPLGTLLPELVEIDLDAVDVPVAVLGHRQPEKSSAAVAAPPPPAGNAGPSTR